MPVLSVQAHYPHTATSQRFCLSCKRFWDRTKKRLKRRFNRYDPARHKAADMLGVMAACADCELLQRKLLDISAEIGELEKAKDALFRRLGNPHNGASEVEQVGSETLRLDDSLRIARVRWKAVHLTLIEHRGKAHKATAADSSTRSTHK